MTRAARKRRLHRPASAPRDEPPNAHRADDRHDPRPPASTTDTVSAGPAPPAKPNARHVDHHVRFTVYRPDRVKPVAWNTLLAFAYRGADPEEGGADIRESYKEVEGQARSVARRPDPGIREPHSRQPAGHSSRGHPSTRAPGRGSRFNPPERSFQWVERIHQETFRLDVELVPAFWGRARQPGGQEQAISSDLYLTAFLHNRSNECRV